MNLNSVKDTPIDIEIEVKEQELLTPQIGIDRKF